MDNQILEKDIENTQEELKEEQKYNYLRSTVEMLEQTLQIVSEINRCLNPKPLLYYFLLKSKAIILCFW